MDLVLEAAVLGGLMTVLGTILAFMLRALRSEIGAVESRLGERFDRVDDRFEKFQATVEGRFDRVDARFEKFETAVDARSEKQGTDIGSEIRQLRESVTGNKESLARIETTLAAQGRQLERMADQGERIAALEGAIAAAS